jgi:hypothetical protein
LVYQSNTSVDQFAVFSEIWYGPDKGWKVTIDDVPSEHIRANYLLRALIVPSGTHLIEFRFDPDSVKIGRQITRWSSLLLVLVLLSSIVYTGYSNWAHWISSPLSTLPPPEIEQKKTKSKKRVKGRKKKPVKRKRK